MHSFDYPYEYLVIKKLKMTNLFFWRFLNEDDICFRAEGLSLRYRNRKLIPFAKRDDCDNLACFEVGKNNKIEIIHDFSAEGYEQVKEYDSFLEWYKDAFNELINNIDEVL